MSTAAGVLLSQHTPSALQGIKRLWSVVTCNLGRDHIQFARDVLLLVCSLAQCVLFVIRTYWRGEPKWLAPL